MREVEFEPINPSDALLILHLFASSHIPGTTTQSHTVIYRFDIHQNANLQD